MTAAMSRAGRAASTAAFISALHLQRSARLGAQHHQVVAMDHLVAATKTQQRFDSALRLPTMRAASAIVVGDQAARDLVSVRDPAR